jgi:hypothetical protein
VVESRDLQCGRFGLRIWGADVSSKKRLDDAREYLRAMLVANGSNFAVDRVVAAVSNLIDAKIADYESRKGSK